jgi:hypothetical protein
MARNPFEGRVTAYISSEYKAEFTAICGELGQSVSERIGRLIQQDIESARRSAARAAAAEDYKASGEALL